MLSGGTNALFLTPEAPILAPVPSILTPKALNLVYIEDLYDLKKVNQSLDPQGP